MDEYVTRTVVGSQVVFTLNDPSTRNALGNQMAHELGARLRELDSDPDLRVGVLTGAGTAFCSGANLNDRKVHATADVRDHLPRRRRTPFEAVWQCSKPIIAAVNGPAVGAGANLALACDLRVFAEDGWMQWPQAGLGVLPGSGTLARLTATVGLATATEWTLTRRRVDASTGRAAGLVSAVAPRDELLEAALSLGEEICASAPLSVRFIKESLVQLVGAHAAVTADADEYRNFILFNTRERKQASEKWHTAREENHAGN